MGDDLSSGIEEILGRKVIAFLSANHVDPDNAIEMFILALASRRAQTPADATGRGLSGPLNGFSSLRLRAGTALGAPREEIVISFRKPRWIPRGLRGYDRPDRLRVGLDSHRLNIDLNVNGPGIRS
jgi:hypothetical protein